MWKSFIKHKKDPAFYIKFEVNDKMTMRVSVTNYVKLWSREFDNDGIIKIMLDSNKDVESDGQAFLKAGMVMLNNPKQVHTTEFIETSTGLNIKLIRIGEIVIKMNFTLSPCCAEHFFDSVTRPLLLIIDDQKKSEKKLRNHLEAIRGFLKKIPEDLLMRYEKKEIEEYNDDTHMKNHNVFEELFGNDADERVDPRHILYGRALPALPYDTPLPIKEEPDSSDPGPSTVRSNDMLIPKRCIKPEKEEVFSHSSKHEKSIQSIDQPLPVSIGITRQSPKQDPVTNEQGNDSYIQDTPKKRRKNLNY